MSGIVSKNAGRASGIVGAGDIGADAVDGSNIADDAIDSEHYADGSIDNAHIADDAIDSEHYAAGSIDEAHIADNAVTLAKMAGGTDGNIISFDASGDPVAIATGDDGQVLTSTGAGSPPAFETAAGGGYAGPYASASPASILSNVTYNTWTKVVLGTEHYDSDSEFTDSKWTCVTAGKYLIIAKIAVDTGVVADKNSGLAIYKNGALFRRTTNYAPTAIGSNLNVIDVIDCSADDYFEMYYWHYVAASTPDINSTVGHVWFTIARV